MTKVMMLISCIEYYGHIKDVPSNYVYTSFVKKGVLKMLLDSYDVFKGMDMGFFMGVIDGYGENEIDAENTTNIHHEERVKLLPMVIQDLMKKTNMDEMELLSQFYTSKTGEIFAEDQSEYYKKEVQEICDLWLEEKGLL